MSEQSGFGGTFDLVLGVFIFLISFHLNSHGSE